MNGKFIVIEGLEGAGKTSARDIIINTLQCHGIEDMVLTREPGGTPLAERLRDFIKQGIAGEVLTDKAEILMLYAARSQLVEHVIKPALARGAWVIGDRHDLSSQAYQGGGRKISTQLMCSLRDMVLGTLHPDLTFYLDVPPLLGLQRARRRGQLDRIELESLAFFERTRARYLTLAAGDDRIQTIDASAPIAQVSQEIKTRLHSWLKQQESCA